MSFIFEKMQHHHGDYLRVIGTTDTRAVLRLPASDADLPVREIAHHAFESDTTLQECVLPDGLQSVGRFAFLNCIHLKILEMSDSVQTFADTALRQCDALALIRVHIDHNDSRVLPGLLAAVEKEITLELLFPDGKAVLLFPDYNYVYTEHTMSRAFLFNIDGCGMVYRECVDFNGVNFREYDKLFEKGRQADPHTAPFLALNRLMYPYCLSPTAKEKYEEYFQNDLYMNQNNNDDSRQLQPASPESATTDLTTSHTKHLWDKNLPVYNRSQDSETVSGVASYAAGDGVFLLSAENRDERPHFLKELILQCDIHRLTFLTNENLLSQKAADILLRYANTTDNYTASLRIDDASPSSAENRFSSETRNTSQICALLMDYLRRTKPVHTGAERFDLL